MSFLVIGAQEVSYTSPLENGDLTVQATTNVRTINTAREFVDYLIHEVDDSCVFRGQMDDRWNLLPSAWRPGTLEGLRTRIAKFEGDQWINYLGFTNIREAKKLAERFLDDESDLAIHRIKNLVIQLVAEVRVINHFSTSCDSIALAVPGIETPQFVASIQEKVSIVGKRPNSHSVLREIPLFEPTNAFAFAQHMGLPTRLLDFSDSPLKAAYFAATGVPNLHKVPGMHLSVWAATRPKVDDSLDPLLRAMQASSAHEFRVLRSQIPFLHAQDGLFISCNALSNLHYLKHGAWPSFEEVMTGWTLEKIRIPVAEADSLRLILGRLGITDISMKPSYDKAVRMTLDFL